MIHVILMILKIIGIILLVILGLLLFAVLSVLFIPVGYRAKVKKDSETMAGQVNVSWLMWLVCFQLKYKDGQVDYRIRILGIPVEWFAKPIKGIGKLVKALPKRKRRKPAAVAPTAPEVEKHAQAAAKPPEKSPEKPEPEAPKVEPKEPKDSVWTTVKKTVHKIINIPAKVTGAFKKLHLTLKKNYGIIKHWKRFLKSESFKETVRFLLQQCCSLFKQLKPKKIKGNVTFGFDDPAMTGQLLAGISLLYPVYKHKLTVVPVFNDKMFAADLYVRGRLFGCLLAKIAWQIYRNKQLKTTIHNFQHKEA